MTATAFIRGTPAMIAPYRITQVQIARIGGSTDHRAAHRTNSSAKCGVTRSCADGSAAGGTQQGTARGTIARIGTATRDEQGRRETQNHCRAHIWLPFFQE
jgi:hypothetical protein